MARLFFPILAFLLLLSQASAAETDENDLFRAAEEGDVGGIRQCLASGCSINVKDHAQMTPLHHAAMAKKPEVIRLLIECGASLSARTAGGLTPADCGVRAGACRAVCFLLQPANGGPGPGVPPAPLSPRMRGLLKSRASGQPSP